MENRPLSLIFDLDGTLTESKGTISEEMSVVLRELADQYELWITTGADYERVKRQLGENISLFTGIYCCNGSFKYEKGICTRQSGVSFPQTMISYLHRICNESVAPMKNGPGIISYPSMINFSVMSVHSDESDRNEYAEWDAEHNERIAIAKRIVDAYAGLRVTVGGKVSVDITVDGLDKSAILKDDKLKVPVAFFADRIFEYGNDMTTASEIEHRELGVSYKVENWEDTVLKTKKYAT